MHSFFNVYNYVTWAKVICLICMPEHDGMQCPRASADISGKSRLHMLHTYVMYIVTLLAYLKSLSNI